MPALTDAVPCECSECSCGNPTKGNELCMACMTGYHRIEPDPED